MNIYILYLQRVAKRATEQEINEAVQFLKEKRNGEYKVAVQIANQETSSFTESQFVKQTTTISLSDIPNYPNVASMSMYISLHVLLFLYSYYYL